MLANRWAPLGRNVWNELQQLQHEVNRAFEHWNDTGAFPGSAVFPPLRVWEVEHDVYVEAELPGVTLEQLEIFVTGQTLLTLKGERQVPQIGKAVEHRQERAFGKFTRSVTLPVQVDDAQVEAKLDNGVLTLRLPKHEGAKPRRIAVKAI